MVISWAAGSQNKLELIVKPRSGLTRRFLHQAEVINQSPRISRFVLFSGPHGMGAAANKYEIVLMIADGFGIAALLPYLKRLIHGYNAHTIRTRRIHLVWQVENIGKTGRKQSWQRLTSVETGIGNEKFLNQLLIMDGNSQVGEP